MIHTRICIDVDDLSRGIEFYTRAFELTLGRRLDRNWVELLGASCPIDLLAKQSGSRPALAATQVRDYRRHWTPVHIDVIVTDLRAAVQRAQAAGATLEGDIQVQAWGSMANMADPFGHGFCLLEFRGRGYDEIAAG
jgi:predicted enzyme related to lactoylglutathione lyase